MIIYPGSGTVDAHRGDQLLIASPFVITKDQIDTQVGILDQANGMVAENIV